MGGQRFGLEGNTNLKTNARQERQINGYPLRSFSAHAPAIILPDKYGGLPMYTRNQTEYADFVSRYTAPLSAVLQNDTVLLGRQGYSVTNESASQPFKDVGFEHNMHKSKDAIDYNEAGKGCAPTTRMRYAHYLFNVIFICSHSTTSVVTAPVSNCTKTKVRGCCESSSFFGRIFTWSEEWCRWYFY